ncbi:MAG: diguanylate cyclase [Fibromonadales bacterium]|nr:diguanylate cyclase [Fibromonadales bacterium]
MEKMKKNSVLIVDDESTSIIALTHILGHDYTIYAATDGMEALEVAQEHLPDIILLDIIMDKMDGYEVLSLLKSNSKTENIPVIFITGLGNNEDEERGLDLGAADYITKPFSPAVVKLRIRNLINMLNMIDTIKQLSEIDQLTGIYNRRFFEHQLNILWEHAKRGQIPLSICMIDIDDFKIYNDSYGHLQGDEALQSVAKSIKKTLKRSVDVVARWGGEEFIALLLDADICGALSVAEKIRKNVEKDLIPYVGSKAAHITVSVGVNTLTPTQEHTIHDFISGADNALYTAKRTGKNKVCKYEKTDS